MLSNNINVGASVKVAYENNHIRTVFPEIRKVLARGKPGYWLVSGIFGPPEEKPEERLVLVEAGPETEETEISAPIEKPKIKFGDPLPPKRRKRKKR